MSNIIVGVVIGIALLIAIAWFLGMQKSKSKIDELVRKHKGDSILAHKAIFLEGRERLPVALSLQKDAVLYENVDMDARLDLDRVDEVEYDDETTTGLSKEGHSVLRIRSHGHVFEFIVTDAECKEWREHLREHHLDEPGAVQAV